MRTVGGAVERRGARGHNVLAFRSSLRGISTADGVLIQKVVSLGTGTVVTFVRHTAAEQRYL